MLVDMVSGPRGSQVVVSVSAVYKVWENSCPQIEVAGTM